MGWSCTKDANDALDRIVKYYKEKGERGSNTIRDDKGNAHFWDTGKEHEDGRITGTVFLVISETMASRVGSFLISPDGVVVRFPGLAKKVKDHVNALRENAFVVIP